MFSELVDKVIRRSNRPDFQEDIIAYINETMRAIQNEALYTRDLVEDKVISPEDLLGYQPQQVYVWKRPARFRQLRSVAYTDTSGNIPLKYPPNIPPSEVQFDKTNYYYGSGDSIVFYDSQGINQIWVAYYINFKPLKYYPEGERPAVFNSDTETWQYLLNGAYVDTLNDEVAEKAARDLVSNWLLSDYNGVVCSGTLTKVFSVLSDPRNKIEYSNFQQGLKDLRSIEKYESAGYNRFQG